MEKLLTLDEQRQRAVWCQQIVQNRRKTWHDKHIKLREYKKGDLVLLYQSRMGPKKPNLTIAWAGPYQIEWVYTNGSVKLIDLAGLALPRYYNASKIKHYDYVRKQVSTPNMPPTEEPIDLNQDLFEAPVVGSVEIVEEYDKIWAAVLDDTHSTSHGFVSISSTHTQANIHSNAIRKRSKQQLQSHMHTHITQAPSFPITQAMSHSLRKPTSISKQAMELKLTN